MNIATFIEQIRKLVPFLSLIRRYSGCSASQQRESNAETQSEEQLKITSLIFSHALCVSFTQRADPLPWQPTDISISLQKRDYIQVFKESTPNFYTIIFINKWLHEQNGGWLAIFKHLLYCWLS